MRHDPDAERWLAPHKKEELNLRHYGAYNRQGRVYAIAHPDTKPVCHFPKKTFTGREEIESFVNELVFLTYSPKGSWFWILKDNNLLSDQDLTKGTLNGKPRTPELSREYIIGLIGQGKLAVFPLNEYIPPEDRTHHLPRAKRPKGADEPAPAGGPGDRVVPLAPETRPEPDETKEGKGSTAKRGADGKESKQSDFRKEQQAQISQALKDQRKMLETKKAELAKWDESAKANFKKAFGTTDESARKMVQGRIDRTLTLNSQTTASNFRSPEPGAAVPGLFAYVYPDDANHSIYLGDSFWSAPPTGKDSKAGTLSHEMSHFDDIGPTVDDDGQGNAIYGLESSRELARSDSDQAVQHADSFQYYLEDVD